MKLLITTQAIDKNDPILGFFHRWVEEFAKHFEHIHVICLREGEHSLPANVTVHSLGKENGENRFRYMWKFYATLRKIRGDYDAVFSHMNPHYIVLAGMYWRFTQTPLFFWRNHARMNWMTRIAAPLATRVFYTSPFACTARYAHAVQMPVGIDTELFSPKETQSHTDKTKVLYLGRLSPVKRIEVLLEAVQYVPDTYEIHIYGDDPTPNGAYKKTLEGMGAKNTFFHPAIRNADAPKVFRAHDVCVNMTPKGSMDKTVLEAAACGTAVVVANESFLDTVDAVSLIADSSSRGLATAIMAVAGMPPHEQAVMREVVRKRVIEKHSLTLLAERLSGYIHGTL